jgi:hypothetical protein
MSEVERLVEAGASVEIVADALVREHAPGTFGLREATVLAVSVVGARGGRCPGRRCLRARGYALRRSCARA